MVVELVKDVYWVGAVDWDVRYFHGYELSTHRGTSYNAYLVKDEKIALIDTVWDRFSAEFLDNVRSVVDPAKIEVVVMNHAEPDHSGCLPEIAKLCPNATIYLTKQGQQILAGHYHQEFRTKVVATGDKISLGKRELTFVQATMLHWPDTMFTYLSPDAVFFTNDAFGQHYAAGFRFNDQVNRQELYAEALKYYANILTPYSEQVIKKIDEILAMKLPLSIIAPSHGVIWRQEPVQIVNAYRQWAQQQPAKRAVIVYDTMWQATRRMAEAIGDGLREAGVPFALYHAAVTDRNDITTEILQAKAVVVGSSTINNGLLPAVLPILDSLKCLRFKNKIGAAFGSYGWSGECIKMIEEYYQKAGIPIAAQGVRAKWQPAAADLEACRAMGRELAAAILKD